MSEMQHTAQHIHFLGIAGIGVSALAQVAAARGVRVSGSDPGADPHEVPAIARLLAQDARIYRTHRAENLADEVDLVVASAAISDANPEIAEAKRRGLRIVSRAEFLGELMAAHKGPKIAVAGTHGKTTTTAMIGVMLQHAGLAPTVFVGGEVPQLGGNVRIGSETGPFVAEACEAYDSFLYLKPDIAVITNIEADHLDHYGTTENLYKAFCRFALNVPFDKGFIVACIDDFGGGYGEGVLTMLRTLGTIDNRTSESDLATLVSYGITDSFAKMQAGNIDLEYGGAWFNWYHEQGRTHIMLKVYGIHNIYNALAAATVGNVLEVPKDVIAEGLGEFQGAGRRQETLGEVNGVLVMDDYAHHPTEIRATLSAMRDAHPNRRIVAIFQPHLYSRTRDFLTGFAEELAKADALIVTDIYAAREQPIAGVTAADIVSQAIKHNPGLPATYLPDKNELPKMLSALVRTNDLVLFMGAGDIREPGEIFVRQMQERSEKI